MSSNLLNKDRCFIIAEIAQAHDGSFLLACAHIEAAAKAGVNAVKFQTHFPQFESTEEEVFRVPIGNYKTRTEYWEKTSFTEEEWFKLAQCAQKNGLVFMSSAFSLRAIDLLEKIGVPLWKVSSGETSNSLLIEKMCLTKKPIIVSTGMSPLTEIDQTVKKIKEHGNICALTQCTTEYPTPAEHIGLNVMKTYQTRYGEDIFVGLSDHSGTIFPPIAGAYAGMDVFETHLCLSTHMAGPDMPASLTPEEFQQVVKGIRFIETARQNPVDKDALFQKFSPMRHLFFQAIYVRKTIPAGQVITEEHLETRKPCKGIPANRWKEILGRTLQKTVEAGNFLQESDLH